MTESTTKRTDAEVLLPCPFCGDVPKGPIKSSANDERNGYNFTVTIKSQCGVEVTMPSHEDSGGWCNDTGQAKANAIAAWNRRAAIQPAGDVGIYQWRTKPVWDDKAPWSDWVACSAESYTDYLRPIVGDWKYEARTLAVVVPAQQDEKAGQVYESDLTLLRSIWHNLAYDGQEALAARLDKLLNRLEGRPFATPPEGKTDLQQIGFIRSDARSQLLVGGSLLTAITRHAINTDDVAVYALNPKKEGK